MDEWRGSAAGDPIFLFYFDRRAAVVSGVGIEVSVR